MLHLRSLSCALLLGAVLPAQIYFAASLDGGQEVPPVATSGSGWGIVRLDPPTGQVRIFVRHDGLSAAPTAAHLHQAAAGSNGGVVLGLVAAGPNTYTGTGTLSAAEVNALHANGTYINVHTPTNPSGEIRGQVGLAASTGFSGALSGAQEVPPVASNASGTVVAFFHEPQDRLVYLVETSGLVNITAAHLHTAPAGSNGGVLEALNGAGGTYCGVTDPLDDTTKAQLFAGGIYVNVHTAANPGGELRAQLIKDSGDRFVARIDGAQTTPGTGSPGFGGATVVRGADDIVTVIGGFGGLTGTPTVAHVHLAPAGSNGPIVFPLAISGNQLIGAFAPTASQLADLRAGDWYINVHSTTSPAGEIRGQIQPALPMTTFGRGCNNSAGGLAEAGARGVAAIGGQVTIDLYGALPALPQLFVFGNGRDQVGPLSLPVELPALGLNAPGCYLLTQPDALLLRLADGLGCASLTLDLPIVPALRRNLFHCQWVGLDPAANPAGFVTSNAVSFEVE